MCIGLVTLNFPREGYGKGRGSREISARETDRNFRYKTLRRSRVGLEVLVLRDEEEIVEEDAGGEGKKKRRRRVGSFLGWEESNIGRWAGGQVGRLTNEARGTGEGAFPRNALHCACVGNRS